MNTAVEHSAAKDVLFDEELPSLHQLRGSLPLVHLNNWHLHLLCYYYAVPYIPIHLYTDRHRDAEQGAIKAMMSTEIVVLRAEHLFATVDGPASLHEPGRSRSRSR